ncbi:hypothetical protein L2E82_31128 [Cichorium intybus]|uniref:Uncharacterized protein n=1 Tax=Cichorium intybus TaxID=13427 RepID=A0ACB9D2P5_CICIN|nr:hypothetical protein L2E82_31128 [Cichorium intybus]
MLLTVLKSLLQSSQEHGYELGLDTIGIDGVSHGCTGMAGRACSLVALEPSRVAENLKARLSWYRDCKAANICPICAQYV